MIFTPAEIQQLALILERTHLAFIGSQLGTDILTPKDVRTLREHGIDVSLMPKTGKVDLAFKFGLLAQALGKKEARNMSFAEMKGFIESGHFVPLSTQEKFALQAVKQHAYSDIKGLENRIVRDTNQIVIEKSRARRLRYEKLIRDVAVKSVRNGATASQMASELGHKTQDWARDFDRIADYVLHESFDLGKAYSVQRSFGDNALVYKEVYDGACDHCQDLYLTDGIGSRPKLFVLKDLLANGSNVGRKTKEWLPVVGPTHPWCRCELENVPPNYAWDEASKSFQPQRVKKIARKSKVHVTVTSL